MYSIKEVDRYLHENDQHLHRTRMCRPAALFIPIVAVVYSIKEVESYLQAILVWQLNHNFLSEVQREFTDWLSCSSAV